MRAGRSKHGRLRIIGALAAPVLLVLSLSAATPSSVDAAFKAFWDAIDVADATKAVDAVVKSGVSFDDAYARLKAGRTYPADAARGVVKLSRISAGGEFFYDLNVPATYTPAKKYQVRFQLHGGTGGRNDNKPRPNASIETIGSGGAEQIYVTPYAWRDAEWWSDLQLENLRGILDKVKRLYNVDENRVVLSGVSDGGTGTYYIAMRDTTQWASFLPLNGFVAVLMNVDVDPNEMFLNNYRNKPFYVINGGEDQLYPTRIVEPYLEHLINGDVSIEYHPQPDAGHNVRWWPQMKDSYEAFVRKHPRDPHPARLTWDATGTPSANRAHWLVIDKVSPGGAAQEKGVQGGGAQGSGSRLPDLNLIPNRMGWDTEMFPHRKPSGHVDVIRTDNTVVATARGVDEFTLLLSPDVFDFSQPIRVSVNRQVMFDGRVEKSVATLMKWSARDNDRTMLYGAEVHIKVNAPAGTAGTSK